MLIKNDVHVAGSRRSGTRTLVEIAVLGAGQYSQHERWRQQSFFFLLLWWQWVWCWKIYIDAVAVADRNKCISVDDLKSKLKLEVVLEVWKDEPVWARRHYD